MISASKTITFIFVFICGAIYAHADEMSFFKYLNGNDYSVYVSNGEDNVGNQSAKDTIVKKLMGAKFSLADVSRDFYQIKIIPNVMFFGENLTQYNIEPLSKDRFSHTVWVNKCGKLIKTEVYDLNGKLVFAFGVMDLDAVDKSAPDVNKEKKLKRITDKPFYKGFYHAFTKKMPENVLHLVFIDGINKFSVFINFNPTGDGAVSKIIYGNYLLSQVVSGIEYTVVGSVPYSFMEEVIDVLDSSKTKIFDEAFAGHPVTEELLKIQSGSNKELKSEDTVK